MAADGTLDASSILQSVETSSCILVSSQRFDTVASGYAPVDMRAFVGRPRHCFIKVSFDGADETRFFPLDEADARRGGGGERRKRRPTWVGCAEEAGNLIEGLPCRIVNSSAESLNRPIALNPHQQRMPTRDHQADRGKCWRARAPRAAQPRSPQVSFKVIDRKHWEAACPRPSTPNASADKQRPHEAWPRRQRYPLNLASNAKPLRLRKDLVEKAWEPLVVRARRYLRYHPAERRMDCRLTRHALREHLSAATYEGDGTLITA
jgi:hypothetical protein